RRAERAHRLLLDLLEHGCRLHFSQTDMGRTCSRHGPNESPAIGMEHRKRPEVSISRSHVMVNEGPYNIDICVPMSDHHALRPCSGATGVVEGQEIILLNGRSYIL